MPRWRNWQTRNVEVVVEATPCWFKSSSGHLQFRVFFEYSGAGTSVPASFVFKTGTFPL